MSETKVKKVAYTFEEKGQNYQIMRLSRTLSDKRDIFRIKKFSEYVKEGIITSALLRKRYLNDNGILSDEEQEDFAKSIKEYYEIELEFRELELKKDLTKKELERKSDLQTKLFDVTSRVYEFREYQSNMFENTAEGLVFKDIIRWDMFYLLKKENGDDVFLGSSYDEKLDAYDKLSEEAPDTLVRFYVLFSQWEKGFIDIDSEESWKAQDDYIVQEILKRVEE